MCGLVNLERSVLPGQMRHVVARREVQDGTRLDVEDPEAGAVTELVGDLPQARRDRQAARVAVREQLGDSPGCDIDPDEVEVKAELLVGVSGDAGRDQRFIVDPAAGVVEEVAIEPGQGLSLARGRRYHPY